MSKGTNISAKNGTSKTIEGKSIIMAVIFVCLLIVLAISFTYAYFGKSFTQSGTDPKTDIETGLLDIDFVTSQYISNSDGKLINDDEAYLLADKTIFSVSRSEANTTQRVYYTLSLVDINITDNLKSPYLKWSLYETTDINDSTEPLSSGTFENLDGTVMSLYDTKIPLAETAVDDFVLLIWLSNDESKNQTELLEGTITAKVQVTAVNS